MTQLNGTKKLLISAAATIAVVVVIALIQHRQVWAQNSGHTMLIFDYITTVPGFDTGIAITNTSRTPLSTGQSGTCSLTYYGTARNASSLPNGVNTPEIPAGAQLSFVVSS